MRNYGIDTLRALAILAVVLIHIDGLWIKAGDSDAFLLFRSLWRIAVPFFFIASAYFLGLKLRDRHLDGSLLKKYSIRLLTAYAFWTLFYFVNIPEVAKILIHADSFQSASWNTIALYKRTWSTIRSDIPQFLLTGNTYFLWFIPALWIGLMVSAAAVRFGFRLHWVWLAGVLYAVDVAFLNDFQRSIAFAILLCAIGLRLSVAKKFSAGLSIAIILLGILADWITITVFQVTDMAANNHFGIGAILLATGSFMFALAKPSLGQNTLLPRIGRYTLGIYVTHPFFIESLLLLPLWNTTAGYYLLAMAAFLLAFVLSHSLSRFPWARGLVQ